MLGDINGADGYSGVTIPERGIIVGKGVHTSGMRGGQAMMQHEYGHILQHRIVGAKAYYSVIAPESLASAAMNGKLGWSHTPFGLKLGQIIYQRDILEPIGLEVRHIQLKI